MPYGRLLGMLFVLLGSVLGAVAFFMLESTGSTFKLFVAGPGIAALGVAMVVFPGHPVTVADMKATPQDQKANVMRSVMTEAPLFHKVAWGIAVTIGVVGGMLGLGLL